jgi:hypothetical protein
MSVRKLQLVRTLFEVPSLQLTYNRIINEMKFEIEQGHSCPIQGVITF